MFSPIWMNSYNTWGKGKQVITNLLFFLSLFIGCHKYINVTSNASRSVQANSTETGITLCDKDQTWFRKRLWIRFISDNDDLWIPQGCPPQNVCNTNAPGSLYHGHPMVHGTVRRQIYFRFGNKCLSNFLKVFVSNCKTFFVYKLLNFPVNLSCNYRICAERGKSDLLSGPGP